MLKDQDLDESRHASVIPFGGGFCCRLDLRVDPKGDDGGL